MATLFDSARHEPLVSVAWSEARARETILRIVRDAERRFDPAKLWPLHPKDGKADPAPAMYHGACGVVWALGYLDAVGIAPAKRSFDAHFDGLQAATVAWLGEEEIDHERASYLFGEVGLLMMRYGRTRDGADADRLAALIEGNVAHPARELMWGAPGTMLAALFLHRLTGDERWAVLFRASARALWAELEWSEEYGCRYWIQDLYGRRSRYVDAVHGFVGTASPLIAGRHLLDVQEWQAWRACIAQTVVAAATREGPLANWKSQLAPDSSFLVQHCHGAPGFIVCLGDYPGDDLDDLLAAGGELTWKAGPLRKGSNLCHGTGGNGYAFLKLFERTGEARWLERARAFAMHAIGQFEADAQAYDGLRYSLWTGDPGLAVYLFDCIRGKAAFPTMDVFYAA